MVAQCALTSDDRFAITDLFARYAWAYDCGDAEEYAAVFTPDGVMAGDVGETAVGRDAIRAEIGKFFQMRGAATWQHFNDHLKVEGNGNGDGCTVYSYWAVLKGSHAAGSLLEQREHGVGSQGYYVSRCVKIDGQWYCKERTWHFDMPRALPWKMVPNC
jgi:ketosteroid isomerase-like protein